MYVMAGSSSEKQIFKSYVQKCPEHMILMLMNELFSKFLDECNNPEYNNSFRIIHGWEVMDGKIWHFSTKQ